MRTMRRNFFDNWKEASSCIKSAHFCAKEVQGCRSLWKSQDVDVCYLARDAPPEGPWHVSANELPVSRMLKVQDLRVEGYLQISLENGAQSERRKRTQQIYEEALRGCNCCGIQIT
jgi:hypothetical protein